MNKRKFKIITCPACWRKKVRLYNDGTTSVHYATGGEKCYYEETPKTPDLHS